MFTDAWCPKEWYWERALGYTREEEGKVWEYIMGKDNNFWLNLEAYKDLPKFDLLDTYDNDLYFITNRPGQAAKAQTEEWLDIHLDIYIPTVLIASKKGAACQALNLDVYIDDKLENIQDVEVTSPSTRAYLINRSYNVNGDVLRRADTVSEVLKREGYGQ